MPASLEDEIRRLRDRFWSERDPDGRVFAPLADAHRRAGELDRAAELVEDGLSRLPEFAPGHLVSARILRDRGDAEAASAAYRRALELDPENVEALREAAAVAEGADRTARALELWHRLSRLEPEDPGLREHVRELKRRHFEVEPAEEAAGAEAETAAAEVEVAGEGDAGGDGSEEVYTRTMAELYARQGLTERAAAVYRRLLEQSPDDEDLRARLEELERATAGAEAPADDEAAPAADAASAAPADGEPAGDDEGSIASYFGSMLDWPTREREEDR